MEPTGGIAFVSAEIAHQLGKFRRRQNDNRKWTLLFTVASSALSAFATVLIGASKLYESLQLLSVLAMVASAFATVLSAWSGLFANRKMWVTAGTAVGDLEALEREIGFAQSKSALSNADADAYYKRYSDILQTAEKSWRTTVQG